MAIVVDLTQYNEKNWGDEKVSIEEMFDPKSERGMKALARACAYADKQQQELLEKAKEVKNEIHE